ncbi:MAG TPA: 23S rRNA (adenine(2503)-C(2))-methyltransferase RlmN [Sedimentisphaerales bacterium]|jgi:23S rRNA (adenine2503-C2)-methyltransferase|nr:23S rRNA (adenine(2503)-C(2))-methyltransferase RlmN [Sedimentisphaerales bacterium]HNU31859.1 23S rRNA (adenine(2503)-C(2))-methyltransferase RlmN [Sedimentisphaerales bacterium]
MNQDLKDKTFEELERVVVGLGQKKYLAGYLFKFIHQQDGRDPAAVTTLSKAFRARLTEQGYAISQLKVVDRLTDPDGSAKFLFELADGERIESVLLPDEDRMTLCVSTQVGCPMGCAFCATAKIPFRRDLTAGEIVDQMYTAETSLVVRRSSLDTRETAGDDAGARITNIVYMGMGEPLENYDAVLRSIRILNHSSGRNIGIRHITISTSGVAPAIRRLAKEEIRPRLAISLSAPSDALRDRLMPINRKYPLDELLGAVRAYQAETGQRVTFEYVLIEKVNDTVNHAKLLVKLLRGLMYNVNLIEHNPFSGCEFAGSSRERIQRFADTLKEAGVETTIRFRMGRGIQAACGQLQAGYSPRRQTEQL